MPENPEGSKYEMAMEELRSAIDVFAVLLDDPYKAPEQVWMAWPRVLKAGWNAQVEFEIERRT